jgi:hypothetical protein
MNRRLDREADAREKRLQTDLTLDDMVLTVAAMRGAGIWR